MKPLISIFVPVYNQEPFIVESLGSLLAQTYSPLEIIVSDDRSKDRTFEIAQEMAAKYRGPHKLVLNKNEKNLGITGNVNRMAELAKGELILAAAGDDLSEPQRAQAMFDAWESSGRTATSLHSRVVHIDQRGRVLKRPTWDLPEPPTHRVTEQIATPTSYIETLKPGVFGCAAAWTPVLFKDFGDLPAGLTHEDNVILFRSVLRGRVLFVDTPLVRYRLHDSNLFNSSHDEAVTWDSILAHERRMQRNFASRVGMYQAFIQDLVKARELGAIQEEEFVRASGVARHKAEIYSLQNAFMTGNLLQKARCISHLARLGIERGQLRELIVRLLPGPLFRSLKMARGRLRHRQAPAACAAGCSPG